MAAPGASGVSPCSAASQAEVCTYGLWQIYQWKYSLNVYAAGWENGGYGNPFVGYSNTVNFWTSGQNTFPYPLNLEL